MATSHENVNRGIRETPTGRGLLEPPPAPKRVETAEFRNKASATDDATIFVNCRVNEYYVKALVDTRSRDYHARGFTGAST